MKTSRSVIPMADASDRITQDDLIPTSLPDAFLKSDVAVSAEAFHLPFYDELPNVSLYREQVIAYIEKVLDPLSFCIDTPWITPSMVNNYVKAGLVSPPLKKLYGRDQIATLVAVCIFKQVLSIPAIERLLNIQRITYRRDVAYDYLVNEVTNAIRASFSTNNELTEDSAHVVTRESLLVRSAANAFASKVYLMAYLRYTGLESGKTR